MTTIRHGIHSAQGTGRPPPRSSAQGLILKPRLLTLPEQPWSLGSDREEKSSSRASSNFPEAQLRRGHSQVCPIPSQSEQVTFKFKKGRKTMKRQILGNQVEKCTLQQNVKAAYCNVERKRGATQPKGNPQAPLGSQHRGR